MHNDQSSPVLSHVGENLRRLRRATGLSQSALAAASSTSRRTIINVEAGDANISLAGLDRLAGALGVTFVELVRPPANDTERLDVLAWRGSSPESHATLLGRAPARHEVELWSWSLGEGERYDAEPDPTGWSEMILVTEGRLLVEKADGASAVAQGDYTIFSSAQHYAYINAHAGTTRFIRNVAL